MNLGNPLRRASTRRKVFFAALLLFAVGGLGATGFTGAFYAAELDTKTATFAGGYVAIPTISTVNASGNDGALTWTNGVDETTTDNEIQQIFGADQGATSNCTGAVYSTTVASSITSPTTTTVMTYTDSNRATTPSGINGDWYCYEVVHGWPNTTTPAWTATATTNVQIGLAPISVVITNGNKSGQIDGKSGRSQDTIVITYNQNVTMTSGTGSSVVCSYQTEGVLLLGDTGCTGSLASQSYTVGALSIPLGNDGEAHSTAATISVSGNQVTVSISASGPTTTNSGITFVSSSNGGTVVSAATTDQATACTTGVNCTIGASGSF